MKFPVKKGQNIFVKMQDMFVNMIATTFEGKVTKVNTRSFYVKVSNMKTELRFNKRTGISKDIICYYEAYPNKETYDSIVKRAEQKKLLQKKINKAISKLELNDLLKIEKHIKEIIGGIQK